MQAAILTEPGQFEVGEIERPEPGFGEILVRTSVCGVCTGDVDVFLGRIKGLDYPRFLGHEVSGTVVAVGGGVGGLSEGDRVVLYAEGKGYAEYVVVPAVWAVKLGDKTPFHLALGEPIACSVNGVRKTDPQLNESVCIVGCGFMGLIMLQVFRARGVGDIIAVDRRDGALELAAGLGATHTINSDVDDVGESVRAITDGSGVDIGVEAAGRQETLDLVSGIVRMEGKLVVFGFHLGGPRTVDWAHWNWMAFHIVNGHSRSPSIYVEGMRAGIGLLESGKLDMGPLVTHRFPLGEINDGFRAAADKNGEFLKAVIDF
ncbi:MAG: zinc-binding dehydrogenase [Acidimicrobiia bacterium]|nr:zinc-binding dehydrogenase [Acidimicrobiia bacterium]